MNPSLFLWEEKYRPTKLDDVVIPERLKAEFKKFISEGQIPSLLLSSQSPGTGKTTTAYALCHELGIKPLFLNASLDNSIDDIRTTVMQYATTVSLLGDNIKVVIFDEGDRLSPNAQDALKGIIEAVSKNCRFIITANSKGRITEPLQSRLDCIDFVYSKEETMALSAQMYGAVCKILEAEGVEYKKPVIAQLVTKMAPDNRKLIKTLQKYSKGSSIIDEGILGQLTSADSSVLVDAIKAKNYNNVKKWCMENNERLGEDFFGKFAATMEAVLVDQSFPEVVVEIDNTQDRYYRAPDKYVLFLAMITRIMMSSPQFK